MSKQIFSSPLPGWPRWKSDPRYAGLAVRDPFANEIPETLCEVVNRICDRYLSPSGPPCTSHAGLSDSLRLSG